MRQTENPVVTSKVGNGNEKENKIDHPAFGMIGACRRSGHSILYGSDFIHHNTVAIRICTSSLTRSLAHDWPHARKGLIEVELSEAQWATFVSSMNVGDGVQCTIKEKDGVSVPGISAPIIRKDQFMDEAKDRITRSLTELEELQSMIKQNQAIPAKYRAEMLSKIRQAHMQISQNAPFVVESFSQHMEQAVEKAKVEVNAYATKFLIQSGVAALESGESFIEAKPPMIEFSGSDSKEGS